MKRFSLYCVLALLASCRPCGRPDVCVPTHFIEGEMVEPCGGEPVDLLVWWTQFHDPLLSSFVEKALQCNHDLRIARERICEARAVLGIEFSELLPHFNAFALFNRTRNSETLDDSEFLGSTYANFYQAGFDTSWEIDLFGKTRAAVRAARFDVCAAASEVRNVHVAIASEAARVYIAIRAAQERVALAQSHIKNEKELVEIVKERFNAGLISELDVNNAVSILQGRLADLPQFEIQMQQAIYSLAVLMGQIPESLAASFCEKQSIPCAEGKIPLGLPSELLCRRGDVRRAEFAMRAAGARVVAARRELFPELTLTGMYTWATGFFTEWFQSGSRNWSITPSLTLPLFQGGRIWSNILAQTSIQRQAVLEYERSVLVALEEVESALIAYFKEGVRIEALKKQVEANKSARELSEILYKAGREDFLNVFITERDLFDSQTELINSQEELATSLVAVYKALGGGWECL